MAFSKGNVYPLCTALGYPPTPRPSRFAAVMRTKAQPRPAGSSRTFRLAAAAIAAIAVYVLILHMPITNSSLHHEASAAMGPVTATILGRSWQSQRELADPVGVG